MATIVKITSEPDGYHLMQSQSHRTENWMGEEWIAVPEALIPQLNGGWCDLTIKDGVLTAVTPKERPQDPDPEVEQGPTYEDRISALESAMLAMMEV